MSNRETSISTMEPSPKLTNPAPDPTTGRFGARIGAPRRSTLVLLAIFIVTFVWYASIKVPPTPPPTPIYALTPPSTTTTTTSTPPRATTTSTLPRATTTTTVPSSTTSTG